MMLCEKKYRDRNITKRDQTDGSFADANQRPRPMMAWPAGRLPGCVGFFRTKYFDPNLLGKFAMFPRSQNTVAHKLHVRRPMSALMSPY